MSNLLNVRHHDYHIKMVTSFNQASKAWTDTQKMRETDHQVQFGWNICASPKQSVDSDLSESY